MFGESTLPSHIKAYIKEEIDEGLDRIVKSIKLQENAEWFVALVIFYLNYTIPEDWS